MPGSTTTAFQCANKTSSAEAHRDLLVRASHPRDRTCIFFFYFIAHVAGIGWRWHSLFSVSKAQQAADLDSTGKKSLGTLFALNWLLLFSLLFSPLLVIFLLLLLYLTHLLMASETDVYETQWVVG
jgi:hypothetical protein